MSRQASFTELVGAIIKRYSNTTLPMRWKEATVLDPTPEPSAFWVRESDDLLNIVWTADNDVRDITFYPEDGESAFIVLRYSAISGVQVRKTPGAEVGPKYGLNVTGNYVVIVYSMGGSGSLYWVASNQKEEEELREFIAEFMKKLG